MHSALTEFWLMATSDKRKSAVLLTLMAVLIFVTGRALIDGGPSSASASSSAASRRERIFSDAPSSVALDTTRDMVRLQRPKMTDRNIFQLESSVFPLPPQTDPSTPLPPNSRTELADEITEIPNGGREAELEAQRQLARLRLRSTVLGNRPLALIEVVNGRTSDRSWTRPGDPVGVFTLVRVESRRVVLELNGVEYEVLSDPSER